MRRLKSKRLGARRNGSGDRTPSETEHLMALVNALLPRLPAMRAAALQLHPCPACVVFEAADAAESASLLSIFGLGSDDSSGIAAFMSPASVQALIERVRPAASSIAACLDKPPPEGFAWLIVLTASRVYATMITIQAATSPRGQA